MGLLATRLPQNQILTHSKWRGTPVTTLLRDSGVRVLYDEHLGNNHHNNGGDNTTDFLLPGPVAVLYLLEGDLLTDPGLLLRITRLRQSCVGATRGTVLCEETLATGQYSADVQRAVTIDHRMSFVPVGSHHDAAQFMATMCNVPSFSNELMMRPPPEHETPRDAFVACLRCVPGLGDAKAAALVDKYESVSEFAQASLEELSCIVGRTAAESVAKMLDHLF